MALSLEFEACLNNKCDEISFTDTTGLYNAATNTGGWETPNESGGDVISATITVYDAAKDNLLDTYDVTSAIPDPVTGTIDLGDFTWGQSDGIYTLVYTVIAKPGDELLEYTKEIKVFFYCNLLNCIDEEKVKLVGTCDPVKLSKIKENIDTLEMLLYGAKSAFACGNFTEVATIMETASTLCTQLGNCNCGC